jgi:YggT family protein
MILFANLLGAVAKILHFVLMLYVWVLLFRVILSWISIPSLYQIKVILYHLTEPVLSPIRRFVPPYRFGGLDISPIIVFLIIMFVDSFVVKSMALYAQQLLRPSTRFF